VKTIALPHQPRPLSQLGLGTIYWGTKLKEADELYDTYRSASGNVFDTAHCYAFWLPEGSGASERELGRIVRKKNDRENVFIATKGGHPAVKNGYPRPDAYLSPERVDQDITESLDRLGLDNVDLYFLHRDDLRVGVDEQIDHLNSQIKRGRIKSLGASNWTSARLAEANAYAVKNGLHGFVANQPKFSLAQPNPSKDTTVRAMEQEDAQWHRQTQVAVFAYSPIANGYFATQGKQGAGGWHNEVSGGRLQRVEKLATEFNRTPNQIVLAWLMHQPFPVVPLMGTADVDHLTDALGAAELKLTPTEIQFLAAG